MFVTYNLGYYIVRAMIVNTTKEFTYVLIVFLLTS